MHFAQRAELAKESVDVGVSVRLGVDREFISRRDAEGAENANAFRAKALSSPRNQLTWALAREAWCGSGIHFTQRRGGHGER
ncbi:MAG TPA: hypothetical protein VK752_08815, partial [Bryobacteraceae bacterium]|nr:hypothetical protein [Bryobacteraceae bacterium]